MEDLVPAVMVVLGDIQGLCGAEVEWRVLVLVQHHLLELLWPRVI